MRKFLVVLDDSRECLNAMRFAAMRAAHTGGGVTILSVIPPDEFNHWIGVAEVDARRSRANVSTLIMKCSPNGCVTNRAWTQNWRSAKATRSLKSLSMFNPILKSVCLCLGAGVEKKGPGPLVTQLTKNSGSLPIPITIVPGDLSKEKLEEIT